MTESVENSGSEGLGSEGVVSKGEGSWDSGEGDDETASEINESCGFSTVSSR